MRKYIYRKVPYLDLGEHWECFEVDQSTLKLIKKQTYEAVVANRGEKPMWFKHEPEPLRVLVSRWKRSAASLDHISVYRLNGNHVLYRRIVDLKDS